MLIDKLTEKQEKYLRIFAEKWIRLVLNPNIYQPKQIEEVINDFYKKLNVRNPEIIWCDSPLSANTLINNSNIFELGSSLNSFFYDLLWISVHGLLRSSISEVVSRSLVSSICDVLHGPNPAYPMILDSCNNLIREYLQRNTSKCIHTHFTNSHGIALALFCKYLGVTYRKIESGLLRSYVKLAHQVSWWYPFERVCILCRKPVVKFNENYVIHSEVGPAIEFKDGWKIWALNGEEMEEHNAIK